MKKWLKIALRLAAVLVIFLVAIVLYSFHLAHGKPAWFEREVLSAEELKAATQRAFQKSADTLSYAADITAAQGRRREHTAQTLPAMEIGPKSITINQREIDSFLSNFETSASAGVSEKLARYVSDARLVFVEDRLEVIGTLKNAGMADGTPVSIGLIPSIDDQGQMHLKLADIYGGRLPLPRSLFSNQELKIHSTLMADLPRWQSHAQMLPNGTVEGNALEVQLAKLCLGCLDDQPVNPVFFLRSGPGDSHHFVPIRITDIKIAQQAITLTIRPLSNDELDQVIPDLQKLYGDSDSSYAARE